MAIVPLVPTETTDRFERIPSWTPCSVDPVTFDCQECEIGWAPCRLRLDDSLRHWRAARYNRYGGLLSSAEERDNEIEWEVAQLLHSHGVSVNASLLLEYIPSETLGSVTETELEQLLRKSPMFEESSPRMFRLRGPLSARRTVTSFRPLPISSGTQLELLIGNSPTLGVSRQTRLFKELGGLNQLASFDTRQAARVALDEIVVDCLETVLSARGWTVQDVHRYAVGPGSVPNRGAQTESDVQTTSRLLAAVSAGDLLTKISPADASMRVPDAAEVLIRGNLRLVIREARRRAHGGFLTFVDLVQIGTIGLMTAIERFDPFRGIQFSTYATYWIRQAVGREQANLDRVIRLPVHVVEQLNSLLRRHSELEADLNRPPSGVELADELGLGLNRVEFLIQLASPPESLDLFAEHGDENEGDQSILCEPSDCGEIINLWNRLARENIRENIEEALSSLSSREARVIELRFGIGGGQGQTLEQVGRQFGVTRERIRQIEARALEKLRRSKNARLLRGLL